MPDEPPKQKIAIPESVTSGTSIGKLSEQDQNSLTRITNGNTTGRKIPDSKIESDKFESNKMSLLEKIFFGRRISSDQEHEQRIDRFRALAVLSSDALSSVAYGTEASLAILVTAGVSSMGFNIGVGIAVVVLLAIVTLSYRQTIFHYPSGGGSYIVASDNLGPKFGLIAAAALLIDYVLTVSVSVSAGVDALVSAFNWPARVLFLPTNVTLGVLFIFIVIILNLRGIRESSSIFAIPTYIFIFSFLSMIVIGIVFLIQHPGYQPPHTLNGFIKPTDIPIDSHLTLFLFLTAFASGCSAMTGVEAISDGVPVFKDPKSKNAAGTLVLMSSILVTMYFGTTLLAWQFHIQPNTLGNPTVTSQIAYTLFGKNIFFYIIQFSTTLILVLAANTSFADFPRLSSILATDEYLPHIFKNRGDSLAFNAGIIVLGVFSTTLLVVFEGHTTALINLYAVGVFLAFTLSQFGMVARWLRKKEAGWQHGWVVNAFGGTATALVTSIVVATKFDRGAWIVVILIPILVGTFAAINTHYAGVSQFFKRAEVVVQNIAPASMNSSRLMTGSNSTDVKMSDKEQQSISNFIQQNYLLFNSPRDVGDIIAVVPVSQFNILARNGLAFAQKLTKYVVAIHVIDKLSEEAIDQTQLLDYLKSLEESRELDRSSFDVFNDEDDPEIPQPKIATNNETKVEESGQIFSSTVLGRHLGKGSSDESIDRDLHEVFTIQSPKLIEIVSTYRALARPLVEALREIVKRNPGKVVMVILPEYVILYPWEAVLHNQLAFRLKWNLLRGNVPVILANIPYRAYHHTEFPLNRLFRRYFKELVPSAYLQNLLAKEEHPAKMDPLLNGQIADEKQSDETGQHHDEHDHQ